MTTAQVLPPAKWRIELNAGGGANKYNLYDLVAGGPAITTDNRFGLPLDDRAMNDCLRRASKYEGALQTVNVDPGCNFTQTFVGGQTNGINYSHFGPLSNPRPVKQVCVASTDPANKGRLRGIKFDRLVGSTNVGKHDEVWFADLEISSDTANAKYCMNSALDPNEGSLQAQGMIRLYRNEFTSPPGNFGGEYGCDINIRFSYAQWDALENHFLGVPIQYNMYLDAIQGDSNFERNVGHALASGKGPGRGFNQFVQRARTDGNQNGPFYGSSLIFGTGTINFIDNVVYGASSANGPKAYNFVGGHLGGLIRFHGNQALDSYSGGLIFWEDAGKGMHTTAGVFLFPPWPVSGTAFTFLEVDVQDFTLTLADPWPHPDTLCRFAGILDLKIGEFSITQPNSSRPDMWFWEWPQDQPVDPLDNGLVKFLTAQVGASPSQYSGWSGSNKARYGPTNVTPGPNMTNQDIDNLADTYQAANGSQYPPWFVQGPGGVNPATVKPATIKFGHRINTPSISLGRTPTSVTPSSVRFGHRVNTHSVNVDGSTEVVVSPSSVRFGHRVNTSSISIGVPPQPPNPLEVGSGSAAVARSITGVASAPGITGWAA